MTDDLPRLNHRYRVGTALAVGLAFVLLAAITAAPSDPSAADLEVGGTLPNAEPVATPGGADPSSAASTGQTAAPGGAAPTASTAGSPAAPGGGSPAGTAVPSGPSDQGVTDDEIVIAFTRIDPAFYARFGIPDPEAEKAITAYVDHLNATGGINNRRIRAEILTQADPRYPEPSQQTCRTAFLDRRAFMMINDQRWPGMVECAVRIGRPISDTGYGVVSATSAEFLAAQGGGYWIGALDVDQLARLWVDYIATHLDGRNQKIGILEHYNDELIYASEAVQREMKVAGFKAPSVYQHTEDISTAAIQAANAIAQWKRDGVTLIVPISGAVPVGIGQRNATAQDFHPAWTFSAIAGLDQTDYATFYDDSQFNGATGVTFARLPTQPGQERCKEIFTARWPGTAYSSQHSAWCHMILLNAEVLRGAESQLTLGTWARAFASIGPYQGNHTGSASYGPGKFDGADQVQVLRYENGRMSPHSPFVGGF